MQTDFHSKFQELNGLESWSVAVFIPVLSDKSGHVA